MQQSTICMNANVGNWIYSNVSICFGSPLFPRCGRSLHFISLSNLNSQGNRQPPAGYPILVGDPYLAGQQNAQSLQETIAREPSQDWVSIVEVMGRASQYLPDESLIHAVGSRAIRWWAARQRMTFVKLLEQYNLGFFDYMAESVSS